MAIGNLLCWLRRGRIIGAAGGGKRGACTSGARVCTNGMRASRAGSVGASTAGKPQRSPFAKVGTGGGGLSGPGIKREGGAAKSRRAGGGWQSHAPPSLRAVAPLYRLARGRNTGAVIPSRHPARCRSGPVGQQHGSRHCAAGDVRHLERNPQVLAAVGQRRYLHAHDHRHHHVCTVRGVTGIVRDNGRTEQLHCLARGQESFHL